MNLGLVIDAIRARCPTFEGRVAGAANFADGIDTAQNLAVPCAFVVPLDEDASPDESGETTGLNQTLTERFGVVVCFNNKVDEGGDRRGQGAASKFDAMRFELHRALLNWRIDPVRAARGLLDAEGVSVTPGEGFGPSGAGHVRITLGVDDERLREACERITRYTTHLAWAQQQEASASV